MLAIHVVDTIVLNHVRVAIFDLIVGHGLAPRAELIIPIPNDIGFGHERPLGSA